MLGAFDVYKLCDKARIIYILELENARLYKPVVYENFMNDIRR